MMTTQEFKVRPAIPAWATRSLRLAAEPAAVFGYVARAENLPEWAPAFATAVQTDGDDIIVTNASGERRFRLCTSAEFGLVDFLAQVGPARYLMAATLRIVPAGNASDVLFSLRRLPDESDADFNARLAIVDDELAALRERFAPST